MNPEVAQGQPATPATGVAAVDPRQCDRSPDDMERARTQRAAWDAYYGRFRDSVTSEAGVGKRNRNVKSNRCAAIVDKGASWLTGPELVIEVADTHAPPTSAARVKQLRTAQSRGVQDEPDGDETSTPPAGHSQRGVPGAPSQPVEDPRQIALDDLIGTSDDFKTFLSNVTMMGGVTGHAFVKIVYDSLGKPKSKPQFRLLDSQNVWVLTHPDDVNCALAYVIEYDEALTVIGAGGLVSHRVKRQIVMRVSAQGQPRWAPLDPISGELPEGAGDTDDTDHWEVATYTRLVAGAGGTSTTSSAYAVDMNSPLAQWKADKAGPQVWDYPWPPIVDCMNLPAPTQYYGLPDLPPEIIALNIRLNDIQTDIAVALEAYSQPIPFVTGYEPSAQAIRTTPGTVLPLPEGSTAGVLQPRADIAAAREFANDVRADMDEQSRIGAVALGRQEAMPKGNISGIALELLLQSGIEKNDLKRRLYGSLIRTLCLRLLILAGVATEDDTEIRLHWANLLPRDDQAAAQVALAMSQIGMSEHAIDDVLGVDYDTEREYKQQEKADSQEDDPDLAAAVAAGMVAPAPGAQAPSQGSDPSQPGQPGAPAQPPTPPAPGAQPPPAAPAAQPPAGPPPSPQAAAMRGAMKAAGKSAKRVAGK